MRAALGALRKVTGEFTVLLGGKKIFGVVRLSDPLPGMLMCFRLLGDGLKFLGVRCARAVLRAFGQRKAGEDNSS